MNLKDMTVLAIGLLGRPDKEAEVASLVREVVREVHSMHYFDRDLVEEVIEFPKPSPLIKFPLPPRWRKFKFINPVTSHGVPVRTAHKDGGFKLVQSSHVVTQAGNIMPDCYYIAGSAVVLKAKVAVRYLAVQYYQYPDFSDEYLETWIMADNSELILTGVRGRFYLDNGQEQRGQQLQQAFIRNLQQLIDNHSGGNL